MGIWLTDQGLRASDHQWWTKGFDGFMGYGVDAYGNCCEDCICEETCSRSFVQIWIQYKWLSPCVDLDTSTKVYPPNAETIEGNLFANYGFGCNQPQLPIDPNFNPGDAIVPGFGNVYFLDYTDLDGQQKRVGGARIFTGDDTGEGGIEKIGLLLDETYQDNFTQENFWRVELHAHWYPEFNYPDNVEEHGECNGNYQIFITDSMDDPNEDNILESKNLNTEVGFRGCSENRVGTLVFNQNEFILT